MWQNPGEVPGDGVDNDGNGFVDDVYGFNFAQNTGDVTPAPGAHYERVQVKLGEKECVVRYFTRPLHEHRAIEEGLVCSTSSAWRSRPPILGSTAAR